jgi:hypothetical protein
LHIDIICENTIITITDIPNHFLLQSYLTQASKW